MINNWLENLFIHVNTINYIRIDGDVQWCELCKAFLQEAKWSNNKIVPTFSKYLENASVSSSGMALLTASYFSVCQQQDISNQQALCSLTNFQGLVRSSSNIFRLCNDLATSAVCNWLTQIIYISCIIYKN